MGMGMGIEPIPMFGFLIVALAYGARYAKTSKIFKLRGQFLLQYGTSKGMFIQQNILYKFGVVGHLG